MHPVVAVDAEGDKLKTVWEHPKHDLEECDMMKKRSLVERQGVERYAPERLQEWFAAVPF